MENLPSWIPAAVALTLACGSESKSSITPALPTPVAATARCERPTVAKQRWRHTGLGTLMSGQESASHTADDVIIAAGTPAVLRGKFAYGTVRKDLEKEIVITAMAQRSGCATTTIGESITDKDGRVEITTPAIAMGMYPYFMMVPGDGSSADGMIWAVPPKTKAVLFDIDGTLTTSDGELFEDLLGGSAEMFPDANVVAKRWADAGYIIVYATGRPNLLRNRTRGWLEKHDFPKGALFTVDGWKQAMPTQSGVGAFKESLVQHLLSAGLVFERAYGNASTDACAYMRGGIDPSRVFMTNNLVRTCDGKSTLPLASYTAHLSTLVVPPL
jgi:phosphatidate phosphatase PAH1